MPNVHLHKDKCFVAQNIHNKKVNSLVRNWINKSWNGDIGSRFQLLYWITIFCFVLSKYRWQNVGSMSSQQINMFHQYSPLAIALTISQFIHFQSPLSLSCLIIEKQIKHLFHKLCRNNLCLALCSCHFVFSTMYIVVKSIFDFFLFGICSVFFLMYWGDID